MLATTLEANQEAAKFAAKKPHFSLPHLRQKSM
jgi:hypothetical protein